MTERDGAFLAVLGPRKLLKSSSATEPSPQIAYNSTNTYNRRKLIRRTLYPFSNSASGVDTCLLSGAPGFSLIAVSLFSGQAGLSESRSSSMLLMDPLVLRGGHLRTIPCQHWITSYLALGSGCHTSSCSSCLSIGFLSLFSKSPSRRLPICYSLASQIKRRR